MQTFANNNILGWVIDDFEQFRAALQSEGFTDFEGYLSHYNRDAYNSDIAPLFELAPFKLNLGGETEKSKLITTDKPIGIFDFSLASRGLYRVPEYYSQRLADEKPDRFEGFDLPKGVVPPNYITQTSLLGKNVYTFQDGSEDYDCVIRQKGQTAIDEGQKGAKLKYATRNRKVYLTYKRNRGKVKYVEIYSLFYYTSLSGDLQYAVRHIPALMVADYLESIGIKVRFYMTRFVEVGKETLKQSLDNGIELPMYAKSPNTRAMGLFIQPIIAKDFGQEFDKSIGLMTSSRNYEKVYEIIANYSLKNEVQSRYPNIYGDPDWCQNDYFEGFERYRNKYQEYVKLGLFKSKEVTSDAMLFFHDMVIKLRFSAFSGRVQSLTSKDESESLIDVRVNPFFVWWMRMSGNVLKHKVNILNSDNYKKDIAEIEKDLIKTKEELDVLLNYIPTDTSENRELRTYLQFLGYQIMQKTEGDCIMLKRGRPKYPRYGYNIINQNNQITIRNYVLNIANEITTYAEGGLYETSQEQKEYRNNILKGVLQALSDFPYIT